MSNETGMTEQEKVCFENCQKENSALTPDQLKQEIAELAGMSLSDVEIEVKGIPDKALLKEYCRYLCFEGYGRRGGNSSSSPKTLDLDYDPPMTIKTPGDS